MTLKEDPNEKKDFQFLKITRSLQSSQTTMETKE